MRLLTIDPVSAYLGGGLDSHNNSEVRGALEPVSDMAARLGIAVVTISHFSKNGAASALNRVIGSMAFVAAARAAFMVGADPDDDSDTRRLFLPIKNNLAKMGSGLAFRIEQCFIPAKDGSQILASRIGWDGTAVERTADDILSAGSDFGQDRSARDEAAAFLESMLRDGPRPSREIEAEARGAGISRLHCDGQRASWASKRSAMPRTGSEAWEPAANGSGVCRTAPPKPLKVLKCP